MRKVHALLAGLALVGSMALISAVQAISGASVVSSTFYCDRVDVTYTDVTFDRDNTGTGEEVYTLTVTDGAGVVLFSVTYPRLVGDGFSGGTETFPYITAPTRNDIRVLLVSNAGNGLPEQVIWNFSGVSPCLPAVALPYAGANYVMATITCDTPVYDTPAGTPIRNDRVLAGQHFMVDPTPVDGPDGQQWTRIFVAGFTNPYIPTACTRY